jgi:hypothetical protein
MSDLQLVTSEGKDAPSADRSLKIRRSPRRDRLIKFRESILDLITRTDPLAVLNKINSSDSIVKEAGLELTAELKRFLDMAKIDAMDEQGYFVDYARLQKSPVYDQYRQECSPRLGFFEPGTLSSDQERLAFWINLYNALVVDGVITQGVTQSVGSNSLRLLAFFRQTAYNVGGHRMSCDDIEHGVLRGNRGHPMVPGPHFTSTDSRLAWTIDPVEVRIHFTLNCAGRSCPPIQVYTADRLDEQLDIASRNFVNDDVKLDVDNKQLHLSAIFKWFQADFGGREGVLDFLVEHLPEGERKIWLAEHKNQASFRYKLYDWGLNSTNLGLAG